MSNDSLYPLSFDASSPGVGTSEYLEEPSIRLLAAFFRAKGLAALKEEDRQEEWYQDWIAYQAEHRLYASLLTPARYSTLGHSLNLLKLTRFLEAFAYFSPAHAYSLHVSFLGLFPILMSSNEALKQEAVARLEGGGLLAFAISERAHGSDLLANEFTLSQANSGTFLADGAKYYIGNANAACIVSILAKEAAGSAPAARRAPFALFVLRPGEAQAYRGVRKIRTLGVRPAFVGEFEVRGQPVPASDVLSRGREAWDAVHATVNLGKFFLGFGAVGICAHAFAEAVEHMRRRVLYGKSVLAMPHLRCAVAIAFARLAAMKLYAYRALDYLQASCDDDRRYLLFNAVQKAKVSTEGVKVMGLLSACIGARGFESETYFESALREAQLIPGLEGSTHINHALAAQFLDGYFDSAESATAEPGSVSLGVAEPYENPYWTDARDRNARTVRFGPFLKAYEPLRSVANVRRFVRQVKAFRRFAENRMYEASSGPDAGLVIATGECFATVAYGQLVAENCLAAGVGTPVVSAIFHTLVEDLSALALKLSALLPAGSAQRADLRRVLRIPATSDSDLDAVSEIIAARYGA